MMDGNHFVVCRSFYDTGGNEADVHSLTKLEAWIFKAEPDADVTATTRGRLPVFYTSKMSRNAIGQTK